MILRFLTAILLAIGGALASDYRVDVSITLHDPDLKNRLTSAIHRELRALGDVAIVDDHPSFGIRIVGQTISAPRGYALAVELIRYRSLEQCKEWVRRIAQQKDDWDCSANIDWFPDPTIQSVSLWLHSGSDPEQTAKSIVADFDVGLMVPARQAFQNYKDYIEKKKSAPKPTPKP